MSNGNIFAESSVDIPRNSLFKSLREMWLAQDGARKSKDLAELLNCNEYNVRPQHISQWASGSDGRLPPWWVIMRLCAETGKHIVLSPSEIRICSADRVIGQ
jgi:hypothetical protein